jgi:hypothetical protein
MAFAILEVTSVGDKSPKSKQRDKNQKDAAKDKGKKAPPQAAASQPPGKKK